MRKSQTNGALVQRGIGYLLLGLVLCGCTTMRITNPERTATEQYLESEAIAAAVAQLSADVLRDRRVFIDSAYLSDSKENSAETLYTLGSLRAKLFNAGVRLVCRREDAQIIMEVRSGGIGIDHYEFLIGIPSLGVIDTPEVCAYKTVTQRGYASLAFIAYWADTGEMVASSGPFVGRTLRKDYWILGNGPRTVGNIPSVTN